jgi:hypothetical protein
MRALIVGIVGVAGLIASTALVQAAPTAFHDQAVAAPAITLVVQRCGHGYHREAATPDKSGVWHGKCAPNAPKKSPDSANPPGTPQSPPHS